MTMRAKKGPDSFSSRYWQFGAGISIEMDTATGEVWVDIASDVEDLLGSVQVQDPDTAPVGATLLNFSKQVVSVAGTTATIQVEGDLGNPVGDGYVLSSLIDGTRSWVAPLIEEDVEDIVGAMLVEGAGIDFAYNDGLGTITLAVDSTVVVLSGSQTLTGIKRFQPGGATDTYAELTANGVEMKRHGTSGPVMRQNRSRGTEGAPTKVLANDILGGFLAFAYDGAAYNSCAGIRMKADADHSTLSRPTRVALEAVDQGSTTLREILVGYGNGHFGFATVNAAPAAPPAGYAFFYATTAGQIRARTSTGDHYIAG